MIFNNFKLHAVPTIHEAYCTNPKCKTKPELIEVSNGFLSMALFCINCKSVYQLELVRHQKVPREFLRQCLDEVELNQVRGEATKAFREAIDARNAVNRDKRVIKKSTYKKKK